MSEDETWVAVDEQHGAEEMSPTESRSLHSASHPVETAIRPAPCQGVFKINRLFFENRVLPLLMVFMGYLAMSPILVLVGWRGVLSLLMVVMISVLVSFWVNVKMKLWFFYLALFIVLTSSITGLYWGDVRYVYANQFLIGGLFLIQFAPPRVVDKTVDMATVLIMLLLIGAVIGFVLALAGMPALFHFPNPDGRPNYFFYTTLSNAILGNVIRPAGLYEEPGSLSLYICSVAVMRHLLGKDNKLTWFMLLMGFVTLSLAHLVYVFFHFLAEKITRRNLRAFAMIFAVTITLVYATGFNLILQDKLFQRLVVSEETGSIEGDNRSYRMFNAYELMKETPSIAYFGAHPSCRFDYNTCKTMFPLIGENPLAPMFTNGLIVTWPFYLSLLILFVSPLLGRKYFVAFGFGLLLLQRPEMLFVSGAMISALIMWIVLLSFRKRFPIG